MTVTPILLTGVMLLFLLLLRRPIKTDVTILLTGVMLLFLLLLRRPIKPDVTILPTGVMLLFLLLLRRPIKTDVTRRVLWNCFYPYRELSELYKGTDKYGNEILFMMYLNGLLYQFQNDIGFVVSRYHSVMCSNTINGSRCFLEQETLPLLLSTGWFPYSNMIYMSKHCLF